MAPRKAERQRLAAKGEAEGKSLKGAPRGSYPTNSPGRAVAAKSYSTKAVRAGRMAPATKTGIDKRANAELAKSGKHATKRK